MAKRKSRNPIREPFIPILRSMFDSPAYQKLTNASRTAYTLLLRQRNTYDQKEVVCPYSHAEAYMDRHTFGRAIRQLCELGFIEKTDTGGLYRRTNVYRFIEDWRMIN